MTYTLYIDVAGVASDNPTRREIGKAGSWQELHWMARGAAGLERGGCIHAISEDRRVLYMADMRLKLDPGAPAGRDTTRADLETFEIDHGCVVDGHLSPLGANPLSRLSEGRFTALRVLVERESKQRAA